jgi:hypothetical protein
VTAAAAAAAAAATATSTATRTAGSDHDVAWSDCPGDSDGVVGEVVGGVVREEEFRGASESD